MGCRLRLLNSAQWTSSRASRIAGVIQTQNSINISQVPLLGNLPYLGNLFKHTQVNTSNQELIFFITPRIIQT